MAVDMFLKIDGIEGESSDASHRGEIEIESFSWGASKLGLIAGSGSGAGKLSMRDFTATMPVTKASPRLFIACASQLHITTAVLSVRRSGGQQQDFLKVTMTDVLISNWNQSTGATAEAGIPMDQVSINFSKIHVSYTGQRPDGAAGETVAAGWDVKANKSF